MSLTSKLLAAITLVSGAAIFFIDSEFRDNTSGEILRSDSGKISRILLMNVSDMRGHCLESLDDIKNHNRFFIENADQYNPCFVTNMFYNGNVVDWTDYGQVKLCPERKNIKLFNEVVEKLSNSPIPKDVWSQIVEFNKPFSPKYDELVVRSSKGLTTDSQKINLRERTGSERVWLAMSFAESIGELRPVLDEEEIVWKSNELGIEEPGLTLRPDSRMKLVPDTLFEFSGSLNQMEILEMMKFQAEYDSMVRAHIDSVYQEFRLKNNIECGVIRKLDLPVLFAGEPCMLISANGLSCIDGRSFDWPQDRFHIRLDGENSFINPADETDGITEEVHSKYANSLCCGFQSEHPDNLGGIAGGNMWVTQDFLFIGKNVLHQYLGTIQDGQERRNQLKQGLPADKEKIEDALLESAYGSSRKNQKVVWVGTKNALPDYRSYNSDESTYLSSWQPIYHIDLFFHPLGSEDIPVNEQKTDKAKRFIYLRGIPEMYCNGPDSVLCTEAFKMITASLDTTYELINRSIESSNFEVEWIDLPLVLEYGWFDNTHLELSTYSPFLNGLSEKVNEGHYRYLLPYPTPAGYVWSESIWSERADSSLRTIISNKCVRIDTVAVRSKHYENASGLHCTVKVLARDY